MSGIDLSMIPHKWPPGTVVILVYPPNREPLCVTLDAGDARNAMLAFGAVRNELKPEVMVMFEADGMPDGSHAPLAHFPRSSPWS